MKRNVLIRDVDEEAYRRAKATAALSGMSLGSAVSEALAAWAKEADESGFERDVKTDHEFVRSAWGRLKRHRGKALVVAGGRLQGVFKTLEQARAFSSRFKVALVFVVSGASTEHEIGIGPELEV